MKDFPAPRTRPVPTAPAGVVALVTIALAVAWSPVAAGPPPLTTEPWIETETRAFLKVGDTNRTLETFDLEIPPDGNATRTLRLPPDRPDSAPARIEIEAGGRAGDGETLHRLHLVARFVRPDGVPVRVERRLSLREASTGFFEAGHGPGWRMTLALTPYLQMRPVVRAPEAPGTPVVFRVEVGRVIEGRYLALETNDLSTFLRQPVEYAFRLGRDETLEQLRLTLTPLQLEDDLVEVAVRLDGRLHAGRETPLLLSRTDRLMTGRDTVSEIDAVSGEPADGFRFRVTPLW